MRNYGFWVVNEAVLDSTLAKVTNLKYRGVDPDYPDVERAQVFLDDLAAFGSANQMPALVMMRLGHDQATDQALGMIAEAVSRSKFWGSTAIFVAGAFSQKAPSRSALLISPYTHTAGTDSNMYNTTSMLRTMELILHLRPMTHFDAGARPMAASFSRQAAPAPYQAIKAAGK
jgi:hypothetical protein